MGLIILANGQTTQSPLPTSFMGYSIEYDPFDLYNCVSTTTVIVPGDTTTTCLTSTQVILTTEQTTTNIQSTEGIAYTTVTTTPATTTITPATTTITTPAITTTTTTAITAIITEAATTKTSTLSNVSSTRNLIFVPPTCSNQSIGLSCNISVTTCAMTQPCLNLATCYPNISVPAGYICACVTGYSGVNCEVDQHSSSTCLNGGTYNTTIGNQTICTCPSGKTGDHCEYEVDICANISCKNYGQCVSNYGNWSCECISTSLYSGTYCQIKSSSLRTKEIVSRSFAGVAIGCLATVAGFILIMDILKYFFHINPANSTLRPWKEKNDYKHRATEKRREIKRRNQANQSNQSVVAVRFHYIHA